MQSRFAVSSIQEQKSELRRAMRLRRDGLDSRLKAAYDRRICHRLADIIAERKAKTIHTFLSMGSEPDLQPLLRDLIAQGLHIYAPRVLPDRRLESRPMFSAEQVEPGPFGTRHPAKGPVYAGSFDLIIVPGLAFDPAGNRLGYGGGFYDIFLAAHPESRKVAPCYPFQLVEHLPVEPHDKRLDEIVCPG